MFRRPPARFEPPAEPPDNDDREAVDALKRRFVAGELSAAEFERRLSALLAPTHGAPVRLRPRRGRVRRVRVLASSAAALSLLAGGVWVGSALRGAGPALEGGTVVHDQVTALLQVYARTKVGDCLVDGFVRLHNIGRVPIKLLTKVTKREGVPVGSYQVDNRPEYVRPLNLVNFMIYEPTPIRCPKHFPSQPEIAPGECADAGFENIFFNGSQGPTIQMDTVHYRLRIEYTTIPAGQPQAFDVTASVEGPFSCGTSAVVPRKAGDAGGR